MVGNGAEDDLKQLLKRYPSFAEDVLWKSPSLSNLQSLPGLREEYETILRRIPAKWRKYVKARKAYAKRLAAEELSGLERLPGGRPKKDELASEAKTLKAEGKSYAQVAIILNQRHGARATNAEAIRKLLKSRQII